MRTMFPNEFTHMCTKTFHVFNSWLCVGCYCSAAHSRNATNTEHKEGIDLSPNVSSNHGRRQRSKPRLGESRMMLSSDFTGMK